MRLTKQEYEDLIKKKPSLKPKDHNVDVIPATIPIYVAQLSESFKKNGKKIWDEIRSGLEPREIKIPTQVTHTQERSFIRPPAIKFTIFGDPVGKPRMTQQDKWRKRPVVMRYWKWAALARSSVPKSCDLGLYRQLSFVAYIGFPKSYSLKRRTLLQGEPHLSRGDGDNFLKALQDSLFKQDCVIWKFSGEKRWDDGGGARIEVELR